jgi:hypothetical protein
MVLSQHRLLLEFWREGFPVVHREYQSRQHKKENTSRCVPRELRSISVMRMVVPLPLGQTRLKEEREIWLFTVPRSSLGFHKIWPPLEVTKMQVNAFLTFGSQQRVTLARDHQ